MAAPRPPLRTAAPLFPFTCAVLLLGMAVGRYLWDRGCRSPLPITVIEDAHQAVPVVTIDGVREGRLVGSVGSGGRLVIAGDVVETGSGGTFAIDPRPLLTNVIPITAPPGVQFVASRRGKRYYPLTSASAERLVPANRIYFVTAEEAEEAGYTRGGN